MLAGLLVAGEACRHRETSAWGDPRDFLFTAEASVPLNSDSVMLRVTAVNRAPERRTVQVVHCGMSLAIVSITAGDKARRIWNRSALEQSQSVGNVAVVCAAYALLVSVPPGGSLTTYQTSVPIRAVLGDSLPPGRYRAYLGADARLKGGLVTDAFDLR